MGSIDDFHINIEVRIMKKRNVWEATLPGESAIGTSPRAKNGLSTIARPVV
jgi:hypothetical protein